MADASHVQIGVMDTGVGIEADINTLFIVWAASLVVLMQVLCKLNLRVLTVFCCQVHLLHWLLFKRIYVVSNTMCQRSTRPGREHTPSVPVVSTSRL